MMGSSGIYNVEERSGSYILYLTPSNASVSVVAPISLIDMLKTSDNARWPFLKWDRDPAEIKWLTIHHSAGQRDTTSINWWHYYHTVSKSWSRVGYHFGIAAQESGGEIGLYQMNKLSTVSWHDTRNHDTLGVCMAGDYREGHDVRPNEAQIDLFGQLMAWLIPQLPNLFAIVGHRRWQQTACPGNMEVYIQDLIDSASKYGVEIADLVSLRTANPAAATARTAMAAVKPSITTAGSQNEHA